MQLGLRRESYGIGNLRWLGSRRGVDTARTVTLDVSAFRSASKIETGNYIKSGQPLKAASVDGTTKYVPYGGSGTLAGFLLTDITLDSRVAADEEDSPAPMLDFGRIVVAQLPTGHGINTSSVTTSGQFVWV